MIQIEQTLDSREVAEMVEKIHSELLKDIRRYIGQFNAGKIPSVDFFKKAPTKTVKVKYGHAIKLQRKGVNLLHIS